MSTGNGFQDGLFFFLAASAAHGTSQTGTQTQAMAVTTLDP